MASVPVPGTVMVELRYTASGEQAENTLYFHKTGAWTESEMTALGNDILTWWSTNLQPLITVHVSLNEIFITDLTTSTSGVATITTGLPLPGDASGEELPNNVTAAVSFRTAKRGRSFRGRNYIVGLPAANVSGQVLAAGVAASYAAVWTLLLGVATDNACEWVVVSRFSGVEVVDGKRKPIPRAEGLSTPITTVLFTDESVDSQRGRLPNH